METINLSLTYSVKEKVQMTDVVMGFNTKTTRGGRRKEKGERKKLYKFSTSGLLHYSDRPEQPVPVNSVIRNVDAAKRFHE
jgi:hypothetical protein